MKNVDCELIKDLLPSYIEALTSNNSNQLIEEHLKECKQCKKTIENMKLGVNIKKAEDKEIKYLKKIHGKIVKALFLGISIGLAIIVVFYFSIVVYRYNILNSVLNKVEEYQKVDNVYLEVNETYFNSQSSFLKNWKIQYWYKDSKLKIRHHSTLEEESKNQDIIRIIDFKEKTDSTINNEDGTIEMKELNTDRFDENIFISLIKYEYPKKEEILKYSFNIYTPTIYKKEGRDVIKEKEYDSITGLIHNKYETYLQDKDENAQCYTVYSYSFGMVTDTDMKME